MTAALEVSEGISLQPGESLVLKNISGDEYHAAPGISSSELKALKTSPAHYWNKFRNEERPDTDTSFFAFGRAVHSLVLEPHLFEDEYAIEPAVNKRTKEGKAKLEIFELENQGKTIISPKEHELASRISDAVWSHGAAADLLNVGGIEFESSGWWTDDRTGALLKYRADARAPGFILDLKTTSGPVDYDTVLRESWKYGYHNSAAHYLDGDAACHATSHDHFVLVFVSKSWPHEVGVYPLSDRMIDRGRRENRALLSELVSCEKRNLWPPVNDGLPTELDLPPWIKE